MNIKLYFPSAPLWLCASVLLIISTTATASQVHQIQIDGVINPVSARFIVEAVDRAEDANAEALLIELDTPGGLLESTRDIVQRFLIADVPIIVYVSPAGARAGSAGTFITLAAHIAVMAPGSNIGAAHPVSVGGGGMPGRSEPDSTSKSVMNDKMTNDAAAMIRSIAETRNRNVEWAEKAVRESASITATDALELNVIDLIVPDVDSLLTAIDGMNVKLTDSEVTLNTSRASIELFEMDWRERLFDKLSDPNIAYIFMMLGMSGLMLELYHPGSIFPGAVGAISLLLAFMAFQTLPLNVVGLLLIVLGIILLILEVKVTSFGLLSIGGATCLFLGSTMLIDTDVPALQVSLGLIIPSVVGTVLFVLFAVGMGLRAQSKKVTTGSEGLIGEVGEALSDINLKGQVFVCGEYWQAKSSSEITKGEEVKVIGIDGLMLKVEKVR